MITVKMSLFEMQTLDDLDLLLYGQPDDDSENSEIMCHCMRGRETRLFIGAVPPEDRATIISGRQFLARGGYLEQVHCATPKSHL